MTAYVAALLAAGACSGGGEAAHARLAAAAERTASAGSARIALEQRMSGVAPQQDLTLTGEGVVALGARRGRVTMALAGADAPSVGGGQYEVMFDDDVVYLRMPALSAPTPWVRIDLTALDDVEGAETLEQIGRVDPSEGLVFLSALEDVDELGTEQIRGTPTTRYRVTVDLHEAAEQAPGQTRAFLEQQVDRLGVDALPMEVWLDDEGRVRRQAYTLDLPPSSRQGPDQARFTVDFFDFGAPVDVDPPPAEDVTEMQDLLTGVR